MIKISKIHIRRFRSIMDLKLELNQNNNFVTICGENNAGKTNTLRALNIFFHPENYDFEKDTPLHKLEGTQGGLVYPNITVEFIDGAKTFKIERKFERHTNELTGSEVNHDQSTELNEKQCLSILDKIHCFYIESI